MSKDQYVTRARETELLRRLEAGEYLSKADRKEAVKLQKAKEGSK